MAPRALEVIGKVDRWLRPEFEGDSMDDGPKNIAGSQNADGVTGSVDNRNCTHMFIEHNVGDLADLCRRSSGKDVADHYTGEFVLGGWARLINRFQFMRIGQQVMARYHSDQGAVDRRHREVVNPLAFHHSPRLQQRTVGRQPGYGRGH